MPYNHKNIEKKWQDFWEKNKIFKTKNPQTEEDFKQKKFYALDMFPYPSGAGLHVGHPEGYTANDIISRYKHANGYRILHPMGWDAFGLPAENYAIKTGTHPAVTTGKNIDTFRTQIKNLGFSYDWDREINTTDPKYFQWTQWIFLKLFEKGLAYEQDLPINYCPSCKTGLANEEVLADFTCERCGEKVEKKKIRQWVLGITKYADRLEKDVDNLNWPQGIKDMQKNWIGRSEGCEFEMKKSNDEQKKIRVYTTRIDTVFGMTYAVLAPDHPGVDNFITEENKKDCEKYIDDAKKKSDQDRTAENQEKTGVFTGSYVINPYNGEKVPLWIADYVLGNYGTGAVMAVPAHDERDFAFAKKYDLEIITSIATKNIDFWVNEKTTDKLIEFNWELYVEPIENRIKATTSLWILVNSWRFDWLTSQEAQSKLTEFAEENNFGTKKINYKLRDWLFSRQRYWGEPIPLIHISNEDVKNLPKEIQEIGASIQENLPSKVLILHGWDGKAESNWFPELREFLEKKWVEVFCPNLIDSKYPNLEKHLEQIDPILDQLDENSVIIGHSLGGSLALHAIKKKNISLKKILLVAPTYPNISDEIPDFFGDALEKIQSYIKNPSYDGDVNIKVYLSWNDPYIKMESVEEFYKTMKHSEVMKIGNHNHFQDSNFLSDFISKEFSDSLFIDGKEFSKIHDGLYGKIICDYNLPLKLPEVDQYAPAGDGNSPLAGVDEFVHVKLAENLTGRRETNTMPQWGGSCWYYLRYMDPSNSEALVDPEIEKYWGSVDSYIGGAEHAVLHLLYARFWHKFLFDIGIVSSPEPFHTLRNQGMILGLSYRDLTGRLIANDLVEKKENNFFHKETGEKLEQIPVKMSKSLKNVVNPDDTVRDYGADTLRLYEMSMGEFSDSKPWNTDAIIGSRRFLEKVYRTFEENIVKTDDDMKIVRGLHKTIKKVGEDIEQLKFNTAITALMICVNEGLPKDPDLQEEWKETFTKLLHPFAPHIAEELWEMMGKTETIYAAHWPEYNPMFLHEDTVDIVVQVNGKVRGKLSVANGVMKDEVVTRALELEFVQKWIEGKEIIKEIFIPGKLLSLVVK